MLKFLRILKKDKIPFIALIVLFAMYFLILFADFFAIYPATYANRKLAYQPPSNIYIVTPENKLSFPYTYNFEKYFDEDALSIEYSN